MSAGLARIRREVEDGSTITAIVDGDRIEVTVEAIHPARD